MTAEKRPSRILFGSCNSQHYEQPLWSSVQSRNATAFVWAGDAIYADKESHPTGTPEIFRRLYHKQRAHPEYSKVREDMFIFGTVDDHDFGIDNADRTFRYKREAAMEYVETFLALDPESIMAKRARNGDGVYGVKVFDFDKPAGQELLTDEEAALEPEIPRIDGDASPYSERSVAVFVIDVRSNRTPWIQHPIMKYFPDYDGDFLGETQWDWLEEALSRSRATVNVVVNGLQVHADKCVDTNIAEGWARLPKAQDRLYHLLLKVKTPIIISGDVHFVSLSRKDCRAGDNTRSLIEMTTSGMTHSWNTNFFTEPKGIFDQGGYTPWATKMAMSIGHMINPWTELVLDDGMEGAKSGLQYSLDLNYGELDFDWTNQNVQVRAFGVSPDQPLLSVQWPMDNLDSISSTAGPWQCVNYRGEVEVTLVDAFTMLLVHAIPKNDEIHPTRDDDCQQMRNHKEDRPNISIDDCKD